MKSLLYIGTLAHESTSFARLCALDEFYETETVEFPDINKGLNRIKERFNLNIFKKQKLVINKIQAYKFDIIWIDKPTFVTLKFLKEIKKYTPGTRIVAHVTDDLNISTHHFKNFIAAAEYFNFIFTCNKENIKEFPHLPMFYNELGFDSKHFNLKQKKVEYNYDIIFVGHYEHAYLKQLSEIANKALPFGFNVRVFGSGWWRANLNLNKYKNLIIKSGWISRNQMISYYLQSKLAVALYSSVNRNKTSARIFELAALGVPFLVKPNEIIRESIYQYLDFNEIYNDKFWKEIVNSYPNIRKKFTTHASQYEKYSWSCRISECIKIMDEQIIA